MKKILPTFLFSILLINTLYGQDFTISGTVTDEKNQPIAYASVYVKNTSKGVSANAEGVYKIKLDKAEKTLVFSAIGYKPLEKTVEPGSSPTLSVILAEESYSLQAVTIKANGQDPAYAIIKKAIASRETHLTEIKGYTVDVYLKGLQKLVSAPKKFFGRDIQKLLDLDTNRKGILYLSESQSKYAFQQPDKIHEEMISSKISGRNNAFSFNQASDFSINFYKNLVLDGTGLTSRSFVSPIANNALSYYRYKLLGTHNDAENGIKIYKIQVIAKRKTDPVFEGTIYILDKTWHVKGVNLSLTKATGLNFVDTLNISQEYLKVKDFYVPSLMKFTFNGDIFKFKFEGYYVSVYSNYEINPLFPKKYFTPEILKITKGVNKKDSLFWTKNRPIPLTKEEELDYKRKDSIALRKESKHYLDSVEKANNKFNIGAFTIFGYQISNRYQKKYYRFDPLQSSIFYNTVEGFALKYGVTYRKELEDRKYYSIRPELRYGFANQILTGAIRANYYYNPLKRALVNVEFGNEIADLNPYGTSSLLANSVNTLLFETNLSKFYKRNFISLNTTRELSTGLQGYLNVRFTKNEALQNTSLFSFIKYKDRQFTSNNPFTPETETPLFPTYRSFSVTASLLYTFAQKYTTRPDGKFYEKSKYPSIGLSYRKGIKDIFSSDVDYNLITTEIKQENIRIGLFGYFSFIVGAGTFINDRQIYYPERKHFAGNNSTLYEPDLSRFRYLDFYIYNTDKQYFELHLEHNFAGYIMQKIPLVRKLKLDEYIGINYLTQPDKRHYTEYYFGVKRLLVGISYGWAYDGNKKVTQGFRFTYSL